MLKSYTLCQVIDILLMILFIYLMILFIYLLDITFTEHPESVAMFTGGDLTLTCQATGLPDVTHYDWWDIFLHVYLNTTLVVLESKL